MATSYHEDAWQEYFLLGITPLGGSEIQFAGITEDITAMEWGSKDIEGIPLANGGRVVKRAPMGDESISFKVYPISADIDGSGVIQLFHPASRDSFVDTTDPIAVSNSLFRRKYRIVLLWTSDLPGNVGTAAASSIPGTGVSAYRIQVFNAYMTEMKPSFDDKIMSTEMTFKWTPFQKDGTRNKIEESTVGTAQLAAVTEY